MSIEHELEDAVTKFLVVLFYLMVPLIAAGFVAAIVLIADFFLKQF